MAFTRRLLPDHEYTIEIIFDQVVDEAMYKLKGCRKRNYQKMLTCKDNRMKRICEKMFNLGKDDCEGMEEIIERGVVLTKHLIERTKDNGL